MICMRAVSKNRERPTHRHTQTEPNAKKRGPRAAHGKTVADSNPTRRSQHFAFVSCARTIDPRTAYEARQKNGMPEILCAAENMRAKTKRRLRASQNVRKCGGSSALPKRSVCLGGFRRLGIWGFSCVASSFRGPTHLIFGNFSCFIVLCARR